MTSSLTERTEKIKKVVCYILELEPDDVTPDSSFVEDHGVDSMGAIDLLAALEREFGIVIEPGQLPRMTTLAQVEAVMTEAAGW